MSTSSDEFVTINPVHRGGAPPGCKPKRFTNLEKGEMVQRYLAGEASPAIAVALGTCPNAIRYYLRKAKVMRGPHEYRQKCTLREDAFDGAEHDSVAAYWVGFLMADGCVRVRPDAPRAEPRPSRTMHCDDGRGAGPGAK